MSAKKNRDLQDSAADRKKLKPEETTLDLPGVEDIPGQENIVPPRLGAFADTTVSSDGEEGRGLLDDDETSLGNAGDSNVSPEERAALREAAETEMTSDEEALSRARLDNRDDDGDPLNERVENSGDDLDVPGSELDDDNEEIGEEDEENNAYSLDDLDDDAPRP